MRVLQSVFKQVRRCRVVFNVKKLIRADEITYFLKLFLPF